MPDETGACTAMSHAKALSLELPELPKLDKRDIDAVRNFLPGKLVSRTAALSALVLLALGYIVGIDRALKSLGLDLSPSPWLLFALFPGLPLIAVASQSL